MALCLLLYMLTHCQTFMTGTLYLMTIKTSVVEKEQDNVHFQSEGVAGLLVFLVLAPSLNIYILITVNCNIKTKSLYVRTYLARNLILTLE